MAKGIEINGQLRGKRGGVVYTRMGGQQLSRAHNPAPSQPNTNEQILTKAILATNTQAYKALKKICSKAFEGYKTAKESQARFMSINAERLRNAYINGWEGGWDPWCCLVAPKASVATMNLYQISEGTLDSIFKADGTLLKMPRAGETLAEWCKRLDITRGDTFAIVMLDCANPDDTENLAFANEDANGDYNARTVKTRFGFYQIKITKEALSSNAEALTTNFSSIWEKSHPNINVIMNGWGQPFSFVHAQLPFTQSTLLTAIVQFKTKNRKRNTARLEFNDDFPMQYSGLYGLWMEETWKNVKDNTTTQATNILDGQGWDESDGTYKGKKLYQLTSAKWAKYATFQYVLIGETIAGVTNPVLTGAYQHDSQNKPLFSLACCMTQDNKIYTSDEYGNITLVTVANPDNVANNIEQAAVNIATTAPDQDGWKTQYKKSAIYVRAAEHYKNNAIGVDYRSYDKSKV